MAKKENKKDSISDAGTIVDRVGKVENWAESNPKILFGVIGLLILAVGGYFGYGYYQDSQEAQAQRDIVQAVFYFESDSLQKALDGDINNPGLLDVAKDYGSTKTGKLASYYAGVAFLKQGKFELSRLYLEDFSSDDMFVQARAYSLIGDSYMEENNYEEAATHYEKAANHNPNKFFSPNYLLKQALAYEKLNQPEKAIEAYDVIIDKYFDTRESQKAKKLKGKLSPNS